MNNVEPFNAEAHKTEIFAELVKRLFKLTPVNLAASQIASTCLLVALFPSADRIALVAWYVALTLIVLARYAHVKAYFSKVREPASAQRWMRQFVFGVTLSGLVWGIVMAIFMAGSPSRYWLYVSAIIIAVPGMAMATLSHLISAYRAFILAYLLPGALFSFYLGGDVNFANGMFATGYALVLLMVARRFGAVSRANVVQEFQINQIVGNLSAANEELRKELELRANVEADLREAKTQAELANRAKSQFLANMSHEIRTPMNGVLGMTELLLCGELNDSQRRFAETVQESGRALLKVINDILDFSKIEAGKLEMESIDFDLGQVMKGVVDLFAERARAAGLELTLDVDPAVPLQLRGDPDRLRQVFSNLIGNAIKFTPQGGIAVRVQQTRREAERVWLHVEVGDTGIGIDAAFQEHIFQPFRQADGSTTRRFGGTGLGLSICKQIVELLGGQIGVHSTPGAGSVFWFDVPFALQPPTISAPPSGQRSQAKTLSAPSLRAQAGPASERCLLVAEDNEVNQIMARAMLAKLGWQCDLVSNGQAAIDALRRKLYAGVLMDCQMPVLDGLSATRAIRALEAHAGQAQRVPIIAMTAHAMAGDDTQCIEAGMDAYLSKPYTLAQLQQVLDQVVAAPSEQAAPTSGT